MANFLPYYKYYISSNSYFSKYKTYMGGKKGPTALVLVLYLMTTLLLHNYL